MIEFLAFRYREEGLFMQFRVLQKSDDAAVIRPRTRFELVQPWNNPSEDILRKPASQSELVVDERASLEKRLIPSPAMVRRGQVGTFVEYLEPDAAAALEMKMSDDLFPTPKSLFRYPWLWPSMILPCTGQQTRRRPSGAWQWHCEAS